MVETHRLFVVIALLGGCGGGPAGSGSDVADGLGGGDRETWRFPRLDTEQEPRADTAPELIPNPCSPLDLDGDGFAEDCAAGPDCDEGNPKLNVYCPPCGFGIYEGCPCSEPGKVIPCFEGDPATIGVGVCTEGEQACQGQWWTACLGMVESHKESCNGLDDDCDGQVDEGVLSPCGTCDPLSNAADSGPDTPQPFLPDEENSEGVLLTEEGWIELNMDEVDLQHIWIANSAENTVSKLSTVTGAELGRYTVCADPSRTAVDLDGDVWVGCRGDGGVAKIRSHLQDCEDQNGDGTIQTSEDLDGNNVISGAELLPQGQDECVRFLVHPGGTIQRAVGVDAENHAWVGEWNASTLRRLDPETGEVVQTIPDLPAQPYGLVVDALNTIWISGRGGAKLVRVDPVEGTIQAFSPPQGSFSPYGITLDHLGRIWTANNCCDKQVAWRYDPGTDEWAEAPTGLTPRGITGCMDGRIYVANDQSNRVAVVDADSLEIVAYIELGEGRFPIGMAADFDGYVWAVNQQSGSATKIDIDTLAVVGEYPVGSGPYTYSDMTGYLLHHFTTPAGHFSHIFGLEGYRIQWMSVTVAAALPEDTSLQVRVRTADTQDQLAVAAWFGPFGPFPPESFPLDLAPLELLGALFEVEVSLFTEKVGVTPSVQGIQVEFQQVQ